SLPGADPGVLPDQRQGRPGHGDRRRERARRGRGIPVVERLAGADLHGGHRLPRHRRAARGARDRHRDRAAPRDPGAAVPPGEHAVVVGLGASGLAAAQVLVAEGAAVVVSERRPAAEISTEATAAVRDLGIEVLAGGHRPEHLDGATLVVTSPGVPEREPILVWAADRGLPVWGEIELGARLCRVPYVAVTGTNGKSTTTEMVAAAMRAAG